MSHDLLSASKDVESNVFKVVRDSVTLCVYGRCYPDRVEVFGCEIAKNSEQDQGSADWKIESKRIDAIAEQGMQNARWNSVPEAKFKEHRIYLHCTLRSE